MLAGSGSLSSGSARSRGQLMAAQRLDPQATLIPDGDNTSVAPVKKGNPWTERKEIVAAGVGARSHSAGQQSATVDPGKSPVSTRIDLFEKKRKADNEWVLHSLLVAMCSHTILLHVN